MHEYKYVMYSWILECVRDNNSVNIKIKQSELNPKLISDAIIISFPNYRID
jgi:hypothetical protein